MRSIKNIVVAGPSAAGKTTLVNGLREAPVLGEYISVPRRLITRQPRQGDDTRENTHVSPESFEAMVADGRVYPHWTRQLGKSTVRYGFEERAGDWRLARVYSANNAFLRSNEESVKEILQQSLLVFVTASYEIRQARLRERSPDLSYDEVTTRLEDNLDNLDNLGIPYKIIDTSRMDIGEGQASLRALTAVAPIIKELRK